MNSDTFHGTATDVGGKVQETMGDLTGDSQMRADGLSAQASGKVQKGIGSAREFARKQPLAAAALLGGAGLLVLRSMSRRSRRASSGRPY